MKKRFKYIVLILISLSMTSCYYDEIYEIEITDTVTFADDIQSIIVSSNCATCHNGTQDPDLTSGNEYDSLLDGYVIPGDAESSSFYIQMSNNHGGGVSANNLALIEAWINGGAQ